MALTVIVAYDIRDDNHRAKAAALLQQHGDRIQLSVFRCLLDEKELLAVLTRLRKLIDHEVDSVYAFRQCRTCFEAVEVVGQASVSPPTLYWAVM